MIALDTNVLVRPDRLARALASFRSGRGDFADYVIQQQSREAGAEVVFTFDGDLLKETGFAAS